MHCLYGEGAVRSDQFTTLPLGLRKVLEEEFVLQAVGVIQKAGAKGYTRKLLLNLIDDNQVEAVFIPGRNGGDRGSREVSRRTACISSQVGCRFACAFCASGKGGFVRNLDAGEMVGQALAVQDEFRTKVTNVVFMGVGEPLDNYENTIKAVRILNDKQGLNIGARKITISTSGLSPQIRRLCDEGIQFELSVSLHAADDARRSELMPVNRKYPLKELMAACRSYTSVTGRIITFEYTLIRDLNDSESDAQKLVELLADLPCRVNLIPLSPVQEFSGCAVSSSGAGKFADRINNAGINCTIRRSAGDRLEAACGQLRARTKVL